MDFVLVRETVGSSTSTGETPEYEYDLETTSTIWKHCKKLRLQFNVALPGHLYAARCLASRTRLSSQLVTGAWS